MTPVLAIVTPLAWGFLIPLVYLFRKSLLKWAIPLFEFAIFAITLAAAFSGWRQYTLSFLGGWPAELGIVFVVDKLSAFFLVLVAIGGGGAFLCSYGRLKSGPWRYYVIFFLLQGAMNGVIVTGDIFNLFVFYEIFSLAAYLLVAFTMSWQAIEAGLKYLVMGTVGAFFILLGIAYIFMATGSLNMAILSVSLSQIPKETLTVIAVCLLVGLFIKIGAFPVHFWLPDAHSSAQTAVSALLSGVVVKISVYALIRVSLLFFLEARPNIFAVITAVGVLSVMGGHLMALRQEDIKRLLAYSTVAQIGYILIGVGVGTAAGITAAAFHAVNHMFMKAGLFITAGHITEDMKTRNISELRGLYHHRRGFVVIFTILAAAIIGIPPLSGFMGKWYLMLASVSAGNIVPALALAIGTVLSALYYLRILSAFYSPGDAPPARENPYWPFLVAGAFSVCCVILGFAPFFPPLWGVFSEIGICAMDRAGYVAAVFLE
ncbi:complex I subunit 5 family protein [Acetomicrobium sp. S15 = DSM 107314]|jgi:multicomponent Na+:H+ antiporter subunit D|uniref:complex I subunit 5 family protein n=1 Tax=Acetomicrobium sp. S15 = DSM 107314 TaxID=2529858 RepID=UPI0018E1157E|nr:proton-conducting transporter membrane subunit [Acetomicrobium sp. S15 = DSM 107314]